MAITLTGSKSSGTLSAVGTYSVTVSTTPFSSGDYSVSRYAVLFTSAGVFKGIARVRRYVSTSSLDLMMEFYDPVDGSAVAQSVGDLVHISVNLSEATVSGAGWTYTHAGASVTDQLRFGGANQYSLVLHDESKILYSTWGGSAGVAFYAFYGCVCIFGHRAEPNGGVAYSGCDFSVETAMTSGALVVVASESSGGNIFMHSGGVVKPKTGGATDIRPLVSNTLPYSFVGVSASLPMVQFASGSARHVLRNCNFYMLNNSASMLFWGSGVIDGGYLRSDPSYTGYAIFRINSSGTYSYGASANNRMVVADANSSLPATFASSAIAYTVNLINFVGVPRTSKATFSPTANNSANVMVKFTDTYTNVVSGSVAQVRLNSDSSLEDSTLSTGTSWSPSVLRDSWTGTTQNAGFPHGPWAYGIKRYGYAPVSGAIAASTYDLGAAGTADNVAFGGAVVQAPDASVTLSESAALALATIDTYDDLYDALIAWGCASVANAAYPSLGAYPCTSGGGVINLGTLDLVVDATAASAIAVNTSTDTVTIKSAALAAGSKHSSLTTTGAVSTANGAEVSAIYTDATGTHVTVTAASLVSGSRVQLYNVTDATELLNTTLGSTGLTYATTWTADKTIRLRADHPDYLPLEATGILTASGLTFLATQAEDAVYVGNGIDGSAVTEFAADGLAIHVDVSDPDGYTLVQRLYAWMQHYQTTSAGIASAFFGAMSASDSANYVIDQDKADIRLDNVTASPLMIVGGYLTRRDGSTVIAATSGSIQMDPGRAYVAPGGAAITVPEGERVILLQASGAHIARG